MIAFVKYAASEPINNWINCLNTALVARVPPASMDVLTFENSDHVLFWRHSLRELVTTPSLLFYPFTEPGTDEMRFQILAAYLRQWQASGVVLTPEDVGSNKPRWISVVGMLENLPAHYAFGLIPALPSSELGRQLVLTLDSGWYGRYNWSEDQQVFVSVSRVPYVNSADSLDWAKG